MRRGVAELDGRGEVVGGIVVMRHGENALRVIERVKSKLHELEPSLPQGVRIVTTYDRSDLIERAIETLRSKLLEEVLIVSLVVLLFLWHIPSAIVPIVTIPVSVLLSFIPMYLLGINANLMSLSGIAISVGVLVDGAIVEVENAYKKIQQWQAGGSQGDARQGDEADHTRLNCHHILPTGRRTASAFEHPTSQRANADEGSKAPRGRTDHAAARRERG